MPNIFYLDYVNGNDANDGSDWAHAWKTITLGATAARTAPGDTIRIAKSPAPVSVGNATWNNLSKIVTLASAQNLNIDLCETAWTGTGDCTIARTAVATDAKEGSFCMKLTIDASPQASILQAYFATGELDLSSYQKISFWIKNSGAIVEDNWIVCLCSDVAGADVVDSFLIPAIPLIHYWIPLTLTKVGGDNLGASIKSIAIYSGGTTTGMASKYIYVDDFIACTTDGLNLQSLISKNSLEQGGEEGWYAIQSINGVTINIDDVPNTKGNSGQGYYGATETVTTYKRETIKTDLAAVSTDNVQSIQENGTPENHYYYEGGWNILTTEQDGETFFDGLSGNGNGIESSKFYINYNLLNFYRYRAGIFFNGCQYNTITYISNLNNNNYGLYCYKSYSSAFYNEIIEITNVCNNNYGIFLTNYCNNIFGTISNINNNNAVGLTISANSHLNLIDTINNVNNNKLSGLDLGGYGCEIKTIGNADNNGTIGIAFSNAKNNKIGKIGSASYNTLYGIHFSFSDKIFIGTVTTTGNGTSAFYTAGDDIFIHKATVGEETSVITAFVVNHDDKLFINKINGYSRIWMEYADIISQDASAGGTGLEWKISITNVARSIYYPVVLSIAKIAVIADKLVTVKAYFKKSQNADLEAILACKGGQIAGVVADVIDTCPSDTARNELEITFTPTEAGVVEIEAWAYWLENVADENVIIDDVSVIQAD